MRLAPGIALLLALSAAPGCDEEAAGPDVRCCDYLYPVWCTRFAECDPVTFSLSWRSAGDCTEEQLDACRGGTDAERLCGSRSPASTDACLDALAETDCDYLFGSAGLPAACGP